MALGRPGASVARAVIDSIAAGLSNCEISAQDEAAASLVVVLPGDDPAPV